MDNGLVTNELKLVFTKKGIFDHAKGIVAKWRQWSLTAVAIFGVLTASFEAFAYFFDADLRSVRLYIAAIFLSLFGALFRTIYSYIHDCPGGFERESVAAKRIAQMQRPRWEHDLARQLLSDKLLELDEELKAVDDGRVFVIIKKKPEIHEYVHWVEMAFPNLLRMISIANQLLIIDLPKALGSEDDDSKPQQILSVVNRIRELYMETVAFERSRRSVEPPAGAERLHEFQLGWSSPIRDGIHRMFEFFDKILSLKSLEGQQLVFTVKMEEPDNLAAFNAELQRIEKTFFGGK